jgi:hypothetical protein
MICVIQSVSFDEKSVTLRADVRAPQLPAPGQPEHNRERRTISWQLTTNDARNTLHNAYLDLTPQQD